jgi:hypothetical protein
MENTALGVNGVNAQLMFVGKRVTKPEHEHVLCHNMVEKIAKVNQPKYKNVHLMQIHVIPRLLMEDGQILAIGEHVKILMLIAMEQ